MIYADYVQQKWDTSERVNALWFGAQTVNRRTGSRWRDTQTDEQQRRSRCAPTHFRLSRGETGNRRRSPFVPTAGRSRRRCGTRAAPRKGATELMAGVLMAGEQRAQSAAGSMTWETLLEVSGQRKRLVWEMNVTGKQQPELIERPGSLLVPTSASTYTKTHFPERYEMYGASRAATVVFIWRIARLLQKTAPVLFLVSKYKRLFSYFWTVKCFLF